MDVCLAGCMQPDETEAGSRKEQEGAGRSRGEGAERAEIAGDGGMGAETCSLPDARCTNRGEENIERSECTNTRVIVGLTTMFRVGRAHILLLMVSLITHQTTVCAQTGLIFI